jgi:hypothetical protein
VPVRTVLTHPAAGLRDLLGFGADWEQRAACRGLPVSLFLPGRGQSPSRSAVAACGGCAVRSACRNEAVQLGVGGYRGGTTPAQRRHPR